MSFKRISIFAGHYGSGKTNIAVNYALHLKEHNLPVVIGDLDIVNPYFRTKDSEELLKEKGIELICSAFANTNLDIPSLPQQIYRITDERAGYAVIDLGGDDVGAVALGRIAETIKQQADYEMYFVVNFYRPLTPDAASAYEVMREIENACKISFTAIINNSNLGKSTTVQDIAATVDKVSELSCISSLPVAFTGISEELYSQAEHILEGKLFPMTLQKTII